MNGLAVYGPNIGTLIEVEATAIPVDKGSGTVHVTGVMDEEEMGRPGRTMRRRSQARSSVDNVVTVLKSRLGLRPQDFDIHVNFPGGIPIDGPSAGLSMVTAIASAITGKAVDNTVAMTGEVTIHGFVKPVGGVVPKIKAALEAGVKRVLIPVDSWQEILNSQEGIEVQPVKRVEDVVETVLLHSPTEDAPVIKPLETTSMLSAAQATISREQYHDFAIYDIIKPIETWGCRKMREETISKTFPLLPLRGTLVFPHMVTPLEVGRERSIEAIEQAMLKDRRIVLAAQHQAAVEEPQPDDIHTVGTLCEVKQILKVPEGQVRILVEGLERVVLEQLEDADGYYEATVTTVPETVGEIDSFELEALVRIVREQFEEYVRIGKRIPAEILVSVRSIQDPSRLADTIASQMNISFEEKQEILETFPVDKRLETLLGLLYREREIINLERSIQQRVRKQMEKAQRE